MNTLDPILHECCNPATGFVEGVGCLSRSWNTRIRDCFKGWAQNLKRKIRRPNNEFLSYLFGEGEKISEVSDQVSLALTEYNHNFQALSEHETKVDFNLNSLTQMTQNITRYERHLYTTNVISSLLSAANFKRLYSSLRISNNLQQLTSILQTAGVDLLLKKLSNALLKVTPVCVIRKGQCVTHSYLSQSTSNESVLLHEISSKLVRSTSALVTCIPQLGKKGG